MRLSLSIFLGFIVAIFGAPLAYSLELIGQPNAATEANRATITWQTDVACGTRLHYGLTAGELTQKVEGPVAAMHEVSVTGLAPGTTYHYSVGSARTRLGTGTFTTAGAAPAAGPQPSLLKRMLDVVTPGKKTETAAAPGKDQASAPAATVAAAPPTRQTWANVATLQDHFDRHGHDFTSQSPDHYAAQAWVFLQRARSENLPMKVDDTDGTLRIFDPKSRAFAAYNGTGKTKTYFKPNSPDYWQRQPGRPVRSPDLRFPPPPSARVYDEP